MSEIKPSVSEVMEKHTMKVMQKLESRIPLQIKSFSDFSREYMKLLEEIFDIDYTLENKIFGNFGMDEKSIKLLDNYLEIGSKFYASQIDISNELFSRYLNMRLSMMESYNKFLKEFSTRVRDNNADSKTGNKTDSKTDSR
ncbi:MAG: hypothetical protein OEL56_07310 [Nitrosopumilus sp.]|nr:hypothetical protein [Nitrosopumilus sp.]MDH3516979.1 hypothetical protein [Nitrosopumilus sp.]MDH3565678.1 hypothetical protein [Nitrosopumilus sp.]MDH5416536.1 hypothetical protein [Nitrosopumilus sp.]MDH5555537.1 hypothetical protein [Nitrosopumilus sp.]